jgi:hypothetical protein
MQNFKKDITMTDQIAIDFVAGTHGHFLETTLNKFFGITLDSDSFTTTGTSHKKSTEYQKNKLFCAEHWSDLKSDQLNNFKKIISIRFTPNDLLLVSSVSMARAADLAIHNNDLEVNTVNKLNNQYYSDTLALIYHSYPFLDTTQPSIPRYVLREFYKFGFRDTSINGYWKKQQQMKYQNCEVCYFDFASFYNIEKFVKNINLVEKMVNLKFEFTDEFYKMHNKFLSFIPYVEHKQQCDDIIDCVCQSIEINIPQLTLFQESYINGQLENIFKKEMPFHQDNYFTSTNDVLYYINNQAPDL